MKKLYLTLITLFMWNVQTYTAYDKAGQDIETMIISMRQNTFNVDNIFAKELNYAIWTQGFQHFNTYIVSRAKDISGFIKDKSLLNALDFINNNNRELIKNIKLGLAAK